MDAFHDGEEVQFRRLDDIISGTGPLGLVGRLLNDLELLLVSVEEPPTFALAERDGNWRRAMLEEMKGGRTERTQHKHQRWPGLCRGDDKTELSLLSCSGKLFIQLYPI